MNRPDATLTDDDELAEEHAPDEDTTELGDGPVDDGEQPEDLEAADPAVLALIHEVEHPTERTSYDDERPPQLPQPDRARSVPNLPKVKSNAFIRILR